MEIHISTLQESLCLPDSRHQACYPHVQDNMASLVKMAACSFAEVSPLNIALMFGKTFAQFLLCFINILLLTVKESNQVDDIKVLTVHISVDLHYLLSCW